MRNILLGLLLIGVSSAGVADAPKKPYGDPNVLARYIGVDTECPFTKADVEEVVDGVLIRSRLKPKDYANSPDENFGFAVVISCLTRVGDQSFIYDIDARFIKFFAVEGQVLMYLNEYDNFGTGGSDFTMQQIRNSTERLVTDYIKANFDLAPE